MSSRAARSSGSARHPRSSGRTYERVRDASQLLCSVDRSVEVEPLCFELPRLVLVCPLVRLVEKEARLFPGYTGRIRVSRHRLVYGTEVIVVEQPVELREIDV